jgi:outer membrane protein assembly factor BamB
LRHPHPISSVILILTTLLIGDVWGQQPKWPTEPPPAPLLPAEQAWLTTLSALPAAAGALDADHVYIPLAEGGTVALTRETGTTAWTNLLGTPWPLLLAPGAVMAITTDEVAAIDRASGTTIWRMPLPAHSIAPGIVSGELLMIALENGSVMAVRTSDGGVAWSCALDGLDAPVSLTADTTAVYLTMDKSQVVALALASGRVMWRETLEGMLSPPAVGKDRVLVGSTANAFYGIRAGTGRIEWKWDAAMIGGDVIGAAVDGDIAYFVGLDNLLHAINRGNGNQRWKQPTPTRPIAPPQAFGGIVVVFGVSPAIAAFNAKTGAAAGTYVIPTASGATTPPIPKGRPLVDPELRPFRVAFVVITADGRVIGLRPEGMMFREASPALMTELPGRLLSRERLPPANTTP